MATKQDIRDRAAFDLGILRLNQQLQNQDKTRIESAYAEVYDSLKLEGLATWPIEGTVPDAVTPYVVALVAKNCLGSYGVSDKRYQRIQVAATEALPEIRKNTVTNYISAEPMDY